MKRDFAEFELRIIESLDALAACQDSGPAVAQLLDPVSVHGPQAAHLGLQCQQLRRVIADRMAGGTMPLHLGRFNEIDIAQALCDAILIQQCAVTPRMAEFGDALVRSFGTLAACAIGLLSERVKQHSHKAN